MINATPHHETGPSATLIVEDSCHSIAQFLLMPALIEQLQVIYYKHNGRQKSIPSTNGTIVKKICNDELANDLRTGYFEITINDVEIIHITSSLQIAEALSFPSIQHTHNLKLAYQTIALDWLLENANKHLMTSEFAARLLHLQQPLNLVLISGTIGEQKNCILKDYYRKYKNHYNEDKNPQIRIISSSKKSFFFHQLPQPKIRRHPPRIIQPHLHSHLS